MAQPRNIIYCLAVLVLSACCAPPAHAKQCHTAGQGFVYGENGLVDELLACSLAQSLDLDLTPEGDQLKSTSRTLIDQGLSNKTNILHARLSGLWSAQRPDFVQTGWHCDDDDEQQISSTSVIELSGLALEVVEKLDMPMHRNQHKLAQHRPCKTFDLPLWMCRQSKPIYRTITTWVNRAYFNLTLSQRPGESRPSVERLSPMFTCPETFKQKITHSASSAYLLNRHAASFAASSQARKIKKRDSSSSSSSSSIGGQGGKVAPRSNIVEELPSLGHPSSFTTTQSGSRPAAPPYHNSVKLIMEQTTNSLLSSLSRCINTIDSDLNLYRDHESFGEDKYKLELDEQLVALEKETNSKFKQLDESSSSSSLAITNECSSKLWIKNRIELANQVNSLNDELISRNSLENYNRAAKRNQPGESSSRADDPNQLLDPFGYYHEASTADQMIDDKS